MRTVKPVSLIIICICCLNHATAHKFADYAIIPPSTHSKSLSFSVPTIGPYNVKDIITIPHSIYRYSRMVEKKSQLWTQSKNKRPMQVSVEEQLNIDGNLLFTGMERKGDEYYFIGEFMADGAEGYRLILDISKISKDDRLWVIEPGSQVVFGPYKYDKGNDPELWTPTIFGESVILVLIRKESNLPHILLKSMHYYFSPAEDLSKVLPCPLPAFCIEDEIYQSLTSAYGLLIVPISQEGGYVCTGALLNVSATVDVYEPYFLTANHCFGSNYNVVWDQVEVFWDFTTYSCSENSSENIFRTNRQVPRTIGAKNLVAVECLDAQLIELTGEIPIGDYGRAFLGWDTGEVSKGLSVYGAHYYRGTLLKGAIGRITATDVVGSMDDFGWDKRYHLIEVLWSEGVTTQGSSGFPAMCKDWNYRVIGMLSNGPDHSCVDRSNNYDYLASFHYFFPLIQCYLVPGTKCETDPDCKNENGGCLFKYLFIEDPQQLDFFKSIRSWLLNQGDWGKTWVKFYYQQSPYWIHSIQTNPDVAQTIKSLLSGNEKSRN